jgi:hypothetical protein
MTQARTYKKPSNRPTVQLIYLLLYLSIYYLLDAVGDCWRLLERWSVETHFAFSELRFSRFFFLQNFKNLKYEL